ncbi:MAG: RNA 2',3'-cyclic phosphodiesterase [Candidatus Tectomicrobia bacterium]|nr:RNA 2',3'-cyclic phosphodiesterase [Candidatus Tectomicrobia bacterium]
MPRVFIAIPTPVELQQALGDIQSTFRFESLSLRWVKPSHLHITLVFLGETPAAQLEKVSQAMVQAVAGISPFAVEALSLGCFPRPSQPRVLWMGLHDPSQNLTRLYQQLITVLQSLGFVGENRAFHPHLTLAHIRKPARNPEFRSLLSIYDNRQFGHIRVEAVHLFESHLRPTGPVYTILCSAYL